MTREPDISVVVASFCGADVLERCLGRIAEQADDGTEVIAVSALGADQLAGLEARHPAVRFVTVESEQDWNDPRLEETRVFRLRSAGVRHASGGIVALLEDHAVISPGWLEALRRGHAQQLRIVGGPVDPGAEASIYVWALYLCEYVQLIRPMDEGEAPYISGVNISYRRESLEACREVWRDSLFENEVSDALVAGGHTLWVEPGAWIASELAFPVRPCQAASVHRRLEIRLLPARKKQRGRAVEVAPDAAPGAVLSSMAHLPGHGDPATGEAAQAHPGASRGAYAGRRVGAGRGPRASRIRLDHGLRAERPRPLSAAEAQQVNGSWRPCRCC